MKCDIREMNCDSCCKFIEDDDAVHIEEDIIYCNSCYVDKAFKEFEDIHPICSRFEILDIR